jgi:hypothetical protein
MAKEFIQIFLNAPNCSGRGVRLRALTPTQVDALLERAATLVGKDATVLDVKLAEWREGVKEMLVAVTKAGALTDPNALQDPATAWEPLDTRKIETVDGWGMDALFTARDMNFLIEVYKRFHEVTKDEIEAIVGKAVKVSAD